MEKRIKIADLTPDVKNFNKHTEYGMSLLEKSVRKFGMGRSILIDKDNKIIAGNGITETAADAGIENVRVIETDANEIIAVKRKDISLDSPEGREMALADNATNAANLRWDKEELAKASREFSSLDIKEWGITEWDEPKTENEQKPTENFYRWFLNIEFSSETECEELYNELTNKGYKCKILQ